MKYPKLVIASDGNYTGILLDGVFIGQGVKHMEFVADSEEGGTIRIMDLDVKNVSLQQGTERFDGFMRGLAEKDKQ